MRQEAIGDYPTRAALIDPLTAAIAFPGLTVPLVHMSPRLGACVDGGPGVPDDDRPGVATTRIGAFQTAGYHIKPSIRIGADQLFAVAPDDRRRDLFALGYADA